MTKAHVRLLSAWITLGLSLGGSLTVRGQEGIPEVVRDRGQTLRRIVQFESQGKDLERYAPARYGERVAAYWNAAGLTALFIKYHEPDRRSLENLKFKLRMAFNLEWADRIQQAVLAYRECLEHSRIDDPDAAEAGGGPRLRSIIEARLRGLGEKDPGALLPDVQAEVGAGERLLVTFGGKVPPISTTKPLLPLSGDKFRPLTIDDSLKIAARTGLFLLDPGRAIAELRGELEKAHLQCQTKVDRDLVVFAVSTSLIPDHTADDLAAAIEPIRRGIRRKYFPDRGPDSVPTVVYASMGGEVDGLNLSRAIHLRGHDDLEGYYEPLDHSIILRKNCYFARRPSPWILGTAAHELTHALIKLDYPGAPTWLDEGMASLQEEQDESGPIDNYRLYLLRAAVDSHRMPTLEHLFDPANPDWSGMKAPLMYAMARYFCFYLEATSRPGNRLVDAYRAMKADGTSGRPRVPALATLEKVTGLPTSAMDHDFRRFVEGRDLGRIEGKWGFLRSKSEEFLRSLVELAPPLVANQAAPPLAPPALAPTRPPSGRIDQAAATVPSPPSLGDESPPEGPRPAPGSFEIRGRITVQTPNPTSPAAAELIPPLPAAASSPANDARPRPAILAPATQEAPYPPSPAAGRPPLVQEPEAPSPATPQVPLAPSQPPVTPPAQPVSQAPAIPQVPPAPSQPPVAPPAQPVPQAPAAALAAALPQYASGLHSHLFGKHGTGPYMTLVPVAPMQTVTIPVQSYQPSAAVSLQPQQVPMQLQPPVPYFSPPPQPSVTTFFLTTNRPELNPKMSVGQLKGFITEADRDLKTARLDLSKAQSELDRNAKLLQNLVSEWRSSRESLESRLAGLDLERMLDIATSDDDRDPEETRGRLFQRYKSRVKVIQDDLDVSLMRVRALKRTIHALQAEVEDAEFLIEYKRSLEHAGDRKSPASQPRADSKPQGAGVPYPPS